MHAAVRHHAPAGALPTTSEGQADGPLHHTLEDGRRGGVVRHQRMGQARIPFALPQQRELGLEQRSRLRQKTQLHGRLIIVREVSPSGKKMKQRRLRRVLVPVGEVCDPRVERGPGDDALVQSPLGADGEPVARGLQIGRVSSLDLDVVEHELAEHGDRAAALDVETEEAVHGACRASHVRADQVPYVHDVQKPRLGLSTHARPHIPLPQRRCASPGRMDVQPVLHHVAIDRRSR